MSFISRAWRLQALIGLSRHNACCEGEEATFEFDSPLTNLERVHVHTTISHHYGEVAVVLGRVPAPSQAASGGAKRSRGGGPPGLAQARASHIAPCHLWPVLAVAEQRSGHRARCEEQGEEGHHAGYEDARFGVGPLRIPWGQGRRGHIQVIGAQTAHARARRVGHQVATNEGRRSSWDSIHVPTVPGVYVVRHKNPISCITLTSAFWWRADGRSCVVHGRTAHLPAVAGREGVAP
mmetsp:Transcript_1812/g.5082  ORF Transcript_1812/g.5082 Transcript_1812/m.5082 type:complete len:236 (-) Transcript_1812:305-1012(-)